MVSAVLKNGFIAHITVMKNLITCTKPFKAVQGDVVMADGIRHVVIASPRMAKQKQCNE